MTHNFMNLVAPSKNRAETNALSTFDYFFPVSLFCMNSDLNSVVLYHNLTLSRRNTITEINLVES